MGRRLTRAPSSCPCGSLADINIPRVRRLHHVDEVTVHSDIDWNETHMDTVS
jgi:hypothetical protein